ncbi:MAG: HD domain-containing protein [Candidatus Aenigmarchaeota archaeon]|nr:HD domain-containing protein [Candidatus Aenigmarchaeota archaeon]
MYSKKQPISSLKENERVEDIFVVKIKKGLNPYSNGFYFHLLLSDAEGGNIDYKYWGDKSGAVKQLYDSIRPDSVLLVQGRTALFQGSLQISTNPPDAVTVLQPNEFDPAQFIKPAQRDINEMVGEMKAHIDAVQDQGIKRLLEHIFQGSLLDKFSRHPAAIEIHHNWTGGLLEHCLQMISYCLTSKKLFPSLDQDLLVAGCLLHDIGKLEEIEVTTRIKGTKDGMLRGHISIGVEMVSKAMDQLNTQPETRSKLLHIILSHQGHKHYGSPVEPMFPEAAAIYWADESSAKLAELAEFVKFGKKNTEDDFMYNRRQARNIYLH